MNFATGKKCGMHYETEEKILLGWSGCYQRTAMWLIKLICVVVKASLCAVC